MIQRTESIFLGVTHDLTELLLIPLAS